MSTLEAIVLLITGTGIGTIGTALLWQCATVAARRRAAVSAAEPGPGDRAEVFRDAAGEWRWHVQAANGRIIATSGESYQRLFHAREMVTRLTGLRAEVVS